MRQFLKNMYKHIIICSSIILGGCSQSILHKEGAKEVVNEGVKSLSNELRPALQQSTESIKGYLDSLKINEILQQIKELAQTSNKSIKSAGELLDEVKKLSLMINDKLKSDDLNNLINSTQETTESIGDLAKSINELLIIIKDKATGEEFVKLKEDILKTASNIEHLTNSLKDASANSSETSSLTKKLLLIIVCLLIILATIFSIKIIKSKK